jgi:hypothetical protein
MSLLLPLLPTFVLLPSVEEPLADDAGFGVELGLGFRDTSLLLLDPDNKQIKQCYIRTFHLQVNDYLLVQATNFLARKSTRKKLPGGSGSVPDGGGISVGVADGSRRLRTTLVLVLPLDPVPHMAARFFVEADGVIELPASGVGGGLAAGGQREMGAGRLSQEVADGQGAVVITHRPRSQG